MSKIFDPKNILNYCKLLGCRDDVTHIRTIISRAYFSAFLHAREYIKENLNVDFTGSHEDHEMVENNLELISRDLGSTIRDLKRIRNHADYNLKNNITITVKKAKRVISFNKNDGEESIKLAQWIIDQLPRIKI